MSQRVTGVSARYWELFISEIWERLRVRAGWERVELNDSEEDSGAKVEEKPFSFSESSQLKATQGAALTRVVAVNGEWEVKDSDPMKFSSPGGLACSL